VHVSESAATTIRRIEPADVPKVVDACRWLFDPPGGVPPRWDPRAAAIRVNDLCTARDATAFVALSDRSLIGFCTVYLDLVSIRNGQRAWLNELAVDPAHRSRCIGQTLLATARDWARDHGATHLMLDSSVARTEAHRFYRRELPAFEAVCFGWSL
jgi:GNAT superfamily N-acetyltransferase